MLEAFAQQATARKLKELGHDTADLRFSTRRYAAICSPSRIAPCSHSIRASRF